MTSNKPEGYNEEEQVDFDEYLPDLIDSIRLGYYDEHLKTLVQACFTRRGAIEGDPSKYRHKKSKTEIPAIAVVEAAVVDEPAQPLHRSYEPPTKTVPWLPRSARLVPGLPDYAEDSNLPPGMKVWVGEMEGYPSRVDRSFEVNGKYYLKEWVRPGLLFYLPPQTAKGQLYWEVVRITANGHKMASAVAMTQNSQYHLRSNNPLRESMSRIGESNQSQFQFPYAALHYQLK